MITAEDINGIVDALSQELVAKRGNRIAAIAVLGSAFKSAIAQSFVQRSTITEYADILDVCSELESSDECVAPADLAEDVAAYRQRAYGLLSQRIYANKLRSAKEQKIDLQSVSDEYRIAGLVAQWLKQQQGKLPAKLSPEWIEQHCDPGFVFTIKEYLFDLEKKNYAWERFAALLPREMRTSFDPTRVTLPVPNGFTSDEEAESYFVRLLAHHGLLPKDVTIHTARDLMEIPGFRILLEYFATKQWQKEVREAENTHDPADSSSSNPLPN